VEFSAGFLNISGRRNSICKCSWPLNLENLKFSWNSLGILSELFEMLLECFQNSFGILSDLFSESSIILIYIFFRDIMLATSQEQIEMRMTLANAETRTVQMNNQLKKIDEIVDKTEKLLYQMIPQNVAERLRKGVNPMDTVEVFESVTMLFSGMFN
jgi:hypothetical protein